MKLYFEEYKGLTFNLKLKMMYFPINIGSGAFFSGEIQLHKECRVGFYNIKGDYYITIDNSERVIPFIRGKNISFKLNEENKKGMQYFLANTLFHEYKSMLLQSEEKKAKAYLN